MTSSEHERDFEEQGALKRPGRIDLRLLQNIDNAGDGYPGLQKAIRNLLYAGYMEEDIDLVEHSIKGTSVDINNAELQQLSNIATATISTEQWGYVGALNQGLTQASNVTFAQITMNGNIIMTTNDITFTSGGLVDGVDVSLHDHSGSDKGVAVPFTSLSGDIIYTQLDSLVDVSETGDTTKISRADHIHTDADGSSKIDHVNLNNKGSNTHAQIDTHLGSTSNPHTVTLEQARTAGNSVSGNIDMNQNRIINLPDPVGDSDASTKKWASHGIASDELEFSNDTERNNNSPVITLIKEITVHRNANIRVCWEMRTTDANWYAMSVLKLNGEQVGETRTTYSETYVSYSEDVIVKPGGILQILAATIYPAGAYCYIQNFRLKFSEYVSTPGY